MLHHFQQVVGATGTPVILYDVPGRTGTQISLETYAQIKGDTVVAVKDAVGDFARGVELHARSGYAVYSGDDIVQPRLARARCQRRGQRRGSRGRPPDQVDDRGLPRRQHHRRAQDLHDRLLPATRAIMGVPNYGATTAKAALQLLGVLDNRNVRGPLVPLTDDEVAALRAGLEASHLL